MPRHTIFYSWQSDLPNSINRGFIQDCLERAIKLIGADEHLGLDPSLEHDTQGVAGALDIAETIFRKIENATVFVADISFVTLRDHPRSIPNPNVLIELGYAAKALGWGNVLCIFNASSGRVEDLPFDIRKRIIRIYDLVEGQDKSEVRASLVARMKDDIRAILHRPDEVEAESRSELLSALIPLLTSVIILGSEIEDRLFDPWLARMRDEFENTSRALRDLAAGDAAQRDSLSTALEDLATVLDQFVHFQMHLGCGEELTALVRSAVQNAGSLKAERIDTVPLSGDSITEIRQQLSIAARKLRSLASRAEAMADEGRLEELQDAGSRLGRTILKVGYYNPRAISPRLSNDLQCVGHPLHKVETILLTHRTECVRSIVETIVQASGAFDSLLAFHEVARPR